MGKPISLFTSYHHAENQVTNYCGLMMKLIYEESPRQFQALLADLLPPNYNVVVGPQFEQQRRYGTSVPDLTITQPAFTFLFETKLKDWHYPQQVERHLQSINQQAGTLFLFLLSDAETNTVSRFDALTSTYPQVVVLTLTYEQLLEAMEGVCQSGTLLGFVREFRQFLDEVDVLPRWRTLLDIVNCGRTPDELAAGVFFCPDTGGSYRHRRARWFGAYADRIVHTVHEIEAVVTVGQGGDVPGTSLKWQNNQQADRATLLTKAIALVRQFRPHQMNEVPLQVFLLGRAATTRLQKRSPGGVRTKCYLYHEQFANVSVDELALFLREDLKIWPDATQGLNEEAELG